MKKVKKCLSVFCACSMLTGLLLANPFGVSADADNLELSAKAVSEYNNRNNNPSIANGSKYTSAYGAAAGTPWCAIFVWWCAQAVGVETNIVPKTASSSAMSNLINSNGGKKYTDIGGYQPKVGDFVHLEFHIMIVTAVNGNNVTVTHGNWGNTMSQNTYNWKTTKKFGGQDILDYVSPWYMGDADHDGTVSSDDALLALQMATGSVTPPAEGSHAFIRIDMNKDGSISAEDALLILQMATGKI